MPLCRRGCVPGGALCFQSRQHAVGRGTHRRPCRWPPRCGRCLLGSGHRRSGPAVPGLTSSRAFRSCAQVRLLMVRPRCRWHEPPRRRMNFIRCNPKLQMTPCINTHMYSPDFNSRTCCRNGAPIGPACCCTCSALLATATIAVLPVGAWPPFFYPRLLPFFSAHSSLFPCHLFFQCLLATCKSRLNEKVLPGWLACRAFLHPAGVTSTGVQCSQIIALTQRLPPSSVGLANRQAHA